VNRLAEMILGYRCERLTISGGEPFLQEAPLELLLRRLKKAGIRDVLVFSGRLFEELERACPWIYSLVDALIDGPFIAGNESPLIWKGSDNQELHILTNDRSIVDTYQTYRQVVKDDKLQFVYDAGSISLLGIPQQHKWESIRHGLRKSVSNVHQDQ
jgi:anaerobic ribonucleoside-triphosphate reductase activating protein